MHAQSSALLAPRQLTREDDHVQAGILHLIFGSHESAWHDKHHCGVMTDQASRVQLPIETDKRTLQMRMSREVWRGLNTSMVGILARA